MLRQSLSRYLGILRVNLWLSHSVNMILAFLLLAMAPLIFSINDLGYSESARVIEQYLSVIGILLLSPIFRPELNKDIREVVESKYTSQIGVYLIRILLAFITIILFSMSFIFLLKANNSLVQQWNYIFAAFSTALFLGSMGMLAYGITDQLIIGYMLPLSYFLFNLYSGDRYVKKLYLFSLMKGSMAEKHWLFATAITMIIVTLVFKWIQGKRR